MEEPVLTLDSTRLRAEPGGQTQLSVTVRNPGHLVESFRLDVLGLDPSWSQVHPPELPVYPGQEESAIVVLSPPVNSPGSEAPLPFAVRAVSTLDPDRSVVEEGDLEVGRILDLQAAIVPVTSRARWSGRHRVTYTNWGNSAVHLRLSVTDKDEELGFRLAPEQITVPVGGSASARVRVRPRKPFLRGTPVHRPFQVIGESGGGPVLGVPRSAAARAGVPDAGRPVLDGALQQLPILSRWVVMLGGLLVAAVVALVALGFRAGAVKGADIPDAAPEPPTGLTATALTDKLIQLRWAPTDRATSYKIMHVDSADNSLLDAVNITDGATGRAVKAGKAKQKACYKVVALRTLASQPSKRVCATTLAGGLDAPTNVKITPTGEQSTVTWDDSLKNQHIVLLHGSQVGGLTEPSVNSADITIPTGNQCVQVIARRGEESSPPSKQVCVNQAAPAGTATGDPGNGGGALGGAGSGGTDQNSAPPTATDGAAATTAGNGANGGTFAGIIAWLGPYQEQSVVQRVLAQAKSLGATGAQIVPASALPQLGFNNPATLLVVVPNFPTLKDAQTFCTAAQDQIASGGCAPLQIS